MKRFLFLIVALALNICVFGQTDTEFWFVAPEVSVSHGDAPVLLRITTATLPADVEITMPQNTSNFPTLNYSIVANSTLTIDLTALGLQPEVEHFYDFLDGVPGKSNKGIYIESTNPVTAYYEVSRTNNCDIFALKGKNALGTEFYGVFQNKGYNMSGSGWAAPAYSALEIVATEDNTTVTFESNQGQDFYAYGVGTFNVTLDKGQTFSLIPDWNTDVPTGSGLPTCNLTKYGNDFFGRAGADHIGGVRVTSDKNIAITKKDDSVRYYCVDGWGGGCYDLVGDQMVPLDILGLEYIAMRGGLTNAPENVYIVATEDNTDIFIDGVWVDNIDEGQTHVHEFWASGNPFVHVAGDKKISVLHVSGWGCEVGGAILPPTDKCTGSTEVAITRSTSEAFLINLMVWTGAEDEFYIDGVLQDGGAGTLFGPADFTPLPSSPNWLVWRSANLGTGTIPVGVSTLVQNTEDVFHLGVINGGPTSGCRFGYFSDFNELKVNAEATGSGSGEIRACSYEQIQLYSSGGTTFNWWPANYLSDPSIARPIADPPAGTSTLFSVEVSGACGLTDTAFVTVTKFPNVEAQFSVDRGNGCSPLDIVFHETSTQINERYWDFNFSGIGVFQDRDTLLYGDNNNYDPDTTFTHTFINTTNEIDPDSLQDYQIRLLVKNSNDCVDTAYASIIVYPDIIADFTLTNLDDTIGCSPHFVDFINNSTNEDFYYWKFGDGVSSTDTSPSNLYTNIMNSDTIYDAELIVRSQFFCRDTMNMNILIHPYLEAGFTLDAYEGCSPLDVTFTNNSVFEDSVVLVYGTGDTLKAATFGSVLYTYTNTGTNVDTNTVELFVYNDEGCIKIWDDTVIVYPEIRANYTIDPYSECNTDTLTFNNLSNFGLHETTDIIWSWGDGTNSNSTALAVDHIYKNIYQDDTVYSFNLHAESIYGCFDDTTNTINMYKALADFYVDTINGCSPVEVNIVNMSIGNSITNWDWDYGDGIGTSILEDPLAYTYNNVGFDTDANMLVLEVTGTNGCSSKDSIEMKIFPEIHITSITPLDQTICDSTEINFTSTIADAALVGVDYVWNFGDGASSPLTDPDHLYRNLTAAQITYDVTLNVETPQGCTDNTATTVIVDPFVRASYILNVSEGCSPVDVQISNNSKGGIYRWYWDSATGAGIEDYLSNNDTEVINRTYTNTSGADQTFYLTLIAENPNGCQDTLTREILVHSSVKAIFDTDDGIYAGCTPDTVNFDNQTDPLSDAEFFSWDFNDGTSGASTKASPDISHIFINTTINDILYTVTLTAESTFGCTHDTTLDVTAYSNVVANFSITDNEGCPPFETSVLNTSIGNLANSYEWHIDGVLDGAAPVDKSPFIHTYDNLNHLATLDYQVKLIAENAWGCSSEKIDTVTVFEDVTAGYTMDIDNGCNPLDVDFTDASLVPPSTTYIWDFGDGASSGADNPTHTFYNPSRVTDLDYTIEQIVLSANYCSDTITDQVSVYHLPFSKFWIDKTSSCPDLVANMNNFDSDGFDSFEWRFGDGSTDVINTSLSHTYPNTLINVVQNYTLEHWVTTVNGCSDSSSLILNVFPDVIADFTLTPQTGCSPITVSFDSDPSSDPAQYFFWDFGGDGTSNDIAPVHTFTNTWATDRIYDIMMVARSEYDCRDTIFKPVTAYVQPIAEFDINPIVQKFPNNQADIDNKTNNGPFDYLWEFDDGETSIVQEPGSHLYDHWGEYDVKLTVNSQTSACTDNITRTIQILPPDVNADFVADKEGGCLQDGLDVTFTAASSSYSEVYDYYWEFGDGKDATGQIVTHNFEKAGVYYVKLTATGIGGEDYEYETIRVYSNPVANFEVSPRSSMLNYDLVARVEFFNLSECNDTSGCYYLWNFGDGGTSTDRDDTHNYTDLGFYNIGLTVTTYHGCVDSLLKVEEVEVLGAGEITFPNAFTPNGDGLNDVFRPVSEGVIKYELLLYTRWGELIFTTKDLNAGWDGKINGELAKPDVYVWKAEGKFTNGRAFELAGDVTLVK